MDITPATSLEPLHDLLAARGGADWDVCIVGDGSGGGWDKPIGWSGVLVDRASGGRRTLPGASAVGSVYVAELMPYVLGMAWYAQYRGERRPGDDGRILRVHVVTDNEAVATVGKRLASRLEGSSRVKAEQPLWAALMAYERQGYSFTFHHIRRLTWALNSFADDQASACYAAIKAIRWPRIGGREVDPRDCNADDPSETYLHAHRRSLKPPRRPRAADDPDLRR